MNSDRQYDRTMELWRSYSIATSLELAAHLENFAILLTEKLDMNFDYLFRSSYMPV